MIPASRVSGPVRNWRITYDGSEACRVIEENWGLESARVQVGFCPREAREVEMNTIRRLALFATLACLTTPGYSQHRLLAPRVFTDDPLQGISEDAATLDLKAAMRATLAVDMAEANRVERRSPLVRPQPAVQRSGSSTGNWIQRHPKLFGALVGFGIGCPVGAAQVGGSQDDFFNALDEFACPFLGGVGAGAGALIGGLVSR